MSKFYDSLMRLFICYKCNKYCDTPMIILCRTHCSITICSDCIAKQKENKCFKCGEKFAFTENFPLIELSKLIKNEYSHNKSNTQQSSNTQQNSNTQKYDFSIPVVSFNDLANPNTNLNDLDYKKYN